MLRRLAPIAVVCATTNAYAQPSSADAVLAETLFREGKELMSAKRFDVACPKLASSYRIDPGTGTLLALALCHEGEGRIASAWVELTDVMAASAEARPDRAALARERIAQIEPALSKLTVTVPTSADIAGLEILRDGARLDRTAWGTAVPIDGGAHTLEARAPNRKAWTLRFEMGARRDVRAIEVPALPLVSVEQAPPPPTAAPGPDAGRRATARVTAEIALGAVAVVGLGTGAYFGVSALSKIHDAKSQCPNPPNCANADAVHTNETGNRDALIADIALGAGLAAGAAAIILVLTGPSSRPVAIAPTVNRAGGGVTLSHVF